MDRDRDIISGSADPAWDVGLQPIKETEDMAKRRVPKKKGKPAEMPQGQEQEHYAWIKAVIDCGRLSWQYQVKGLPTPGSQSYGDENVSHWSDKEIRDLTRNMLCVDEDDPVVIQITHH